MTHDEMMSLNVADIVEFCGDPKQYITKPSIFGFVQQIKQDKRGNFIAVVKYFDETINATPTISYMNHDFWSIAK